MTSCYFPRLAFVPFGNFFKLFTSVEEKTTQFSFKRIVDTTMETPEGNRPFRGFGLPSISSHRIAFLGYSAEPGSNALNSGIYICTDSRVETIFDWQTPPLSPDQPSLSVVFGLSLSRDNVAFYAANSDHTYRCIGARIDGKLVPIVDTDTPIPGGPDAINAQSYFRQFSSFTIDDDTVIFGGSKSSTERSGIYANRRGTLDVLWTPGVEKADEKLVYPVGRDGRVAFYASHGARKAGIYRKAGDNLHCIVDTTTQMPGTASTFEYLSYAPRVSDQAIAFDGSDAALNSGIYLQTYQGRTLEKVVDSQTPFPGGSGTFAFLYEADEILYALDGTSVAFVGYDSARPYESLGIYTTLGGSFRKVIDVNDALDHKIITSLQVGPEGFCEGAIAFLAGFSDGTQGIYVAEVAGDS